MEEIMRLFESLGDEDQVTVMCKMYYSVYDWQKDEFLMETENG